jgi:predicted membrane-bound spermidine synthase
MVMGFSTLYASESQYASLLATSILLMMPTFLLGIVTPYAVKLATNTLSKLGNIAGNLYSVSTIGSIIGTFLTVFVLIPGFEIRYIIFFLGLTLMILSSLIGLSKLPRILAISVVLLLFFPTTSLVGGIVSHYGTLVYEKETPYSHLDITDLGNARSLYLNGLLHSKMYKDNPTDLAITYTKYFHLGFLFNGDAKNILFIGGGGFSGPKNFLNVYPNATIDVVEIDPDVIDAAKKYFSLDYINSDLKRLRIFNEDARNFISNTNFGRIF